MIVLRKAIVRRRTEEVDITVEVDLDSEGYEIEVAGFFKHMLETFARHSRIMLRVRARGDFEHHVIEDTAISLGLAIRRALGDKKGIARFGYAIVPMDDAVSICSLDLSGRGYLNFEGEIYDDYVHFFDTLCKNAGINAYISVKGRNMHHKIESCFKSFAIAFNKASSVIYKRDVPSTKGLLD